MNLTEFYSEIGGNLQELIGSLGSLERVTKYLNKFPQSETMNNLTQALNSKDYESAFREAHNLKGMSINIGLKSLYLVSSDLTEALRYGPDGTEDEKYKKVEQEYSRTCELINQINF